MSSTASASSATAPTGVFSSWLTLATKSRRVASSRADLGRVQRLDQRVALAERPHDRLHRDRPARDPCPAATGRPRGGPRPRGTRWQAAQARGSSRPAVTAPSSSARELCSTTSPFAATTASPEPDRRNVRWSRSPSSGVAGSARRRRGAPRRRRRPTSPERGRAPGRGHRRRGHVGSARPRQRDRGRAQRPRSATRARSRRHSRQPGRAGRHRRARMVTSATLVGASVRRPFTAGSDERRVRTAPSPPLRGDARDRLLRPRPGPGSGRRASVGTNPSSSS